MDNCGNAIFFFMFDDDSDDEEHLHRVIQAIVHHTSLENEATKHGGSIVSREYKNREREDRHRNLMSDYFNERPHFNTTNFRRQFQMRKELFYRILNDVYCRLGESTALESLRKFCCAVEAVYGQWYLRFPNPTNLYRLLHKASCRGFSSMLGTCSPLFNDVVHGVAPHVEYIVNGNQYYLGYYLADRIYPHWATLVKTISSPDNPKKRLFAQMQEAYRNDVERAFGIGIFDNLHSIMMTCIILHNMIVEDEDEYVEEKSDEEDMCPQRSRRARARQYELEPSITYEYHQDR
ncbi:hypothetical protein ACE6H2_016239 [Prunus campanulata]